MVEIAIHECSRTSHEHTRYKLEIALIVDAAYHRSVQISHSLFLLSIRHEHHILPLSMQTLFFARIQYGCMYNRAVYFGSV